MCGVNSCGPKITCNTYDGAYCYLFLIGFIKVLVFHEPLIWSESAVRWGHTILQLVERTGKL